MISTDTTVKQRWTKEDGLRGDMLERCEKYARWTLPHVFPDTTEGDKEQQNSMNGIGAESVNFISNKIVTTLFSPHSPYFRLLIDDAVMEEAIASKALTKEDFETAFAKAEKDTVREQETSKGLRSSGTAIAKLLVITGNTLINYNTKGKPIKAFSLRDYVVKRDGDGKPYKMITRENKDFGTLPKKVVESLPEDYRKTMSEKVKNGEDADTELFTEIRRIVDENGVMTERWEVQQAVDDNDLEPSGNYTKEKLPWIPLVWHLNRGENYGRGLVEDYAGDFHALTTLSIALVKGLAVLADIKFLVAPGALTDVKEYNESETGSFHVGREGDITSPQLSRGTDLGIINEAIDKYERRISRAFLNGSSNRRQAERVTAEELRMDARDLETSQGGLYSRMVVDWQTPYARLGLADIDMDIVESHVDIQIVAGMDTLSRSGDMDNFRWMLDDLAATQNIPDDIRAAFDPMAVLAFTAANRGVDQTKFSKTREMYDADIQAERDAANASMMMQEGAKTAGALAVEGAKK